VTITALSVASECHPLIKTGGLADVVGALPAALKPHGVEVTTLLPAYAQACAAFPKLETLHIWRNLLGQEARLLQGEREGQSFLLLDIPALYHRAGGLYGDASGADWPDNALRFACLGKAAAEIALGETALPRFDVLHAHDWQAGLAPTYVHYAEAATKPATLITIHNIAYQGRFAAKSFAQLGLPKAANSVEGMEFWGDISYLKAGMASADAVTTVSPHYAQEIRTAEYGMGLEGLIQARGAAVHGILNGIDTGYWNPAQDPLLTAPYTARTLRTRKANKRALEKAFGLKRSDGLLFVVVTRLAWQKGMDVLLEHISGLLHLGARLAVLGSGDVALEAGFAAAAAKHKGLVALHTGYNEPLAHLCFGGGDAILIPSRFEPCGLTQLYGLAYGCVPVVARTGGLADTIIDANMAALGACVATGVMCDLSKPDGLWQGLARTAQLFADTPRWKALQRAGMQADFSWAASGAHYATLYQALVNGCKQAGA
jgi:starch synthase